MTVVIAVIVQIVRLHEHKDADKTKRALGMQLLPCSRRCAATMPPVLTQDREFHLILPTTCQALRFVFLALLMIPTDLSLRFGLAEGDARTAGQIPPIGVALPTDSLWWVAREAIDLIHEKETSDNPQITTWYGSRHPNHAVDPVNGFLQLGTFIISQMTTREKRLTYGLLCEKPLAKLASTEGVSRRVILEVLHRCGGLQLHEGLRQIERQTHYYQGASTT